MEHGEPESATALRGWALEEHRRRWNARPGRAPNMAAAAPNTTSAPRQHGRTRDKFHPAPPCRTAAKTRPGYTATRRSSAAGTRVADGRGAALAQQRRGHDYDRCRQL